MPNIANIQNEQIHGPFSATYLLQNGSIGFVATSTGVLGLDTLPPGTSITGDLDLGGSGVWDANLDRQHSVSLASSSTVTLPLLSAVENGEGIAFEVVPSSSRMQLSPAGSDTLPGGFSSTDHLVMSGGTFLRVIKLNDVWHLLSFAQTAPIQTSSGPDNPGPGLIVGANLNLRNERFNPNSPTGAPANAEYGYMYLVSRSGTFDGRSLTVGDAMIAIRPAPVSQTVYEDNWAKLEGDDSVSSWGGINSNHIDDTEIRTVLERIGFIIPSQAGQDLLADVTETNERLLSTTPVTESIRIGRLDTSDFDSPINVQTFGSRPFTATSSPDYTIWTVVVPTSVSEATVDTWSLVTRREGVVVSGRTLRFDTDFSVHAAQSTTDFRVYETVTTHTYTDNDSLDVYGTVDDRKILFGGDTRTPASALPVITRDLLDPDDVTAFLATSDGLTPTERQFMNQAIVTSEGLPEQEIPATIGSEPAVKIKGGMPSHQDSDYRNYSEGNGLYQTGGSPQTYSIRSRQPLEVRDVVSANADRAIISVTPARSSFAGWNEYVVVLPAYTGSFGLGSAIVRGGTRVITSRLESTFKVYRENFPTTILDELDATGDVYRPSEKESRFFRDLQVEYTSHDETVYAANPFEAGFAFQPIALTLSGPDRDDVTDPHNGSGGNEYIRPLAPGEEPPSISPVQAHFETGGTYTYFPDGHDVANIEFPGYNSYFQGSVRIANKSGQNTITGTETKFAISFAYSLPEDLTGDAIDLLQFGASSPTLQLVTGSGLELKRGAPDGTQVEVFYDSPLRTTDNAQQGSVSLASAGSTAQVDFVTPLDAARNHNYDPELQLLEQRHLTTGVQEATVYHVGDPIFSQLNPQRFTYSFPDPAGGDAITVFADHTYLANEITQDGVPRSIIRVVLSGASTTDRLDFAVLVKEQLSTTGNNSTFQRGHSIGPSDGTDSVAHTPISLSLLFGPTHIGDVSQNPLMSVSVIRDHVHLSDPDNGSHWIDLGVRRSDLQWNPVQVADPAAGITVGGPRVRVSQVQLGTWAPLNRITKRPLESQYFDAATEHQPYYGQYVPPGEATPAWSIAGTLTLVDAQGQAASLVTGSIDFLVFNGDFVPPQGSTLAWPDGFDPTAYREFRVEIFHVSGSSIIGNSGYQTQRVDSGTEYGIGSSFVRCQLTADGLRMSAGTVSTAGRIWMIFRR